MEVPDGLKECVKVKEIVDPEGLMKICCKDELGVHLLSMDKNGSISFVNQTREKFHGSVIVCNQLHNLLSSVKEIERVTNVVEVIDGIKEYAKVKQLYDPQNQSKICCENDELSTVFGVTEFSLTEITRFLPKFVFPICDRHRLSLEKNKRNSIMKEIQEKFHGSVKVCGQLHDLLSSVKEIKLVTNVMEVLDAIKEYINVKQLFDPQNPFKIRCKNDELGKVFGVTEFAINDVAKFLPQFVFPINSGDASSSGCAVSVKRKHEEINNSLIKKTKNESMVLYVPSSSSTTLCDSAGCSQEYESDVIKKDINEKTIYLSHTESLSSDDNFSILAVEETFDVEYEVESLSTCSSDSLFSDSDSDLDALKSAIITVVCKSDSDMEFWADKSSDDDHFSFDAEISDSDKWECLVCGDINVPPSSMCLKCFHKRPEWFASVCETRTRPKRKRRAMRKRAPPSNNFTKEEPSQTSQNDVCESKIPSTTSSQIYSSEHCENAGTKYLDLGRDSDLKLCFLCCERPANGTIVHAHSKYAHSISCYPCARKLQRQKKRCPICRRKIDRVVCAVSS